MENINKIDHSKLDSSRRSHKIKFIEVIKELIISMGLDQTINKLNQKKVIKDKLEQIDNYFTYIFNTARKKVEGLTQQVLFTQMKIQKQIALLY